MSLDPVLVGAQDLPNLWGSLCQNEYARDMTWDHIRYHWDFVYQT